MSDTVTIVTCDDWAALFLNDRCLIENHRLGFWDIQRALKDAPEVKLSDIQTREINTGYMESIGGLDGLSLSEIPADVWEG